jgi:conjugal transfer pilus assembly protein TraV
MKLILILSLSLLSGCSMLIPYEDEFACKRSDNMGKCISTEEAYKELTTGTDLAPYAKPASQQDDDDESKSLSKMKKVDSPNSGYNQYIDANYKETAKLLKAGITPILSSGETIKIVLVPNRVTERMLLSERIMYVIIEEPEFIMGDYLIKKHIPATSLFGE